MPLIAGYQIYEQIYGSLNSLVYRGQRESDGQSVILKVLKEDYPTPEERLRYRQEYEITHSLSFDGVISAYSLETYQHTLVIVFEDIGGQSLELLLKEHPFSLKDVLTIAIQITDSLAQIHSANIIHKDLNPSNIVLNPTTRQLKLIDFGIATQLSREHPTIKHPNVLEGTLAYMSPEQTGRMNRSLDYRTDFYSLGVTLYELLTLQLPFVSDDALELMHCHLAEMPVAPCELTPRPPLLRREGEQDLPSPPRRGAGGEVPQILSDIIMKLMAKTVEDRYQSAVGLKTDLEYCLANLTGLEDLSGFTPGQHDMSGRFQIPETLYGRAQETKTLLQAFERVSAGSTELMLVAGSSGVGKSSLVHEVHTPITAARGFFITGKFDQLQRHIPYAALIQAFQECITLLLTESEEYIAVWKTHLLQAVGQNGKVLTEVLSTLELIIEPQPEIAQLGPTDAQHRFNYVFGNFVKVLAQPDHPLILFLDDLQWADSASLNLLQVLMTDQDLRYMLLIGAYRDHEVSPSHPLVMTIEEMKQEQTVIDTIIVSRLSLEHVSDLLSDTLHNPDGLHELAQVVYEKTQGNAFFVKQLLHTLYEEGVFRFDGKQQGWYWNITAIQQLDITDNVVELMIAKVRRLPVITQRVLTLAACIGNFFDFETLVVISECSPHDTTYALHTALVEGLLLPSGNPYLPNDIEQAPTRTAYRFAHDRIQEAAYALISESEKAAVHRAIGTLLREHLPDDQQDERIFDIVNQLNWGRTAITLPEETFILADLNLRAGNKAKASAAYQPAMRYFTIGTELLPEHSWATHHPLTFALYRERYECEYLTGRFEEAERLRVCILPQTTSRVEQAEIYTIGIVYSTMTSRTADAVDMGRKALRLFGMELPDGDFRSALDRELKNISRNLGTRSVADLIHLPITTDPDYRALITLLLRSRGAIYDTNPALCDVLAVRMMNITLIAGTTIQETPTVYAQYGILLSSLGEYQTAYDFGRLGIQLSERLDEASEKGITRHVFANHINHWRRPIISSVQLVRQAFRYCLEFGRIDMAGSSLLDLLKALLSQGEALGDVLDEVNTARDFATRTHNTYVLDDCTVFRHFVLTLQERTSKMKTFNDPHIDVSHVLRDGQYHPTPIARETTYLLSVTRLQACYVYEQYSEALEMARHAKQIRGYPVGSLLKVEQNFYVSLTLTALYPTATPDTQQHYRDTLRANQSDMRIWTENCPDNFRHRYLLVEAEIARIEDRHWDAVTHYRQAIEAAHRQEFIHHEALGNELLAKFWLAQGEEKLAHVCLIDARYGYQLWGANGKAHDLEQKYPQLLATRSACAEMPDVHTTTPVHLTGSRSDDALDFATVFKASQAISGELVLETLLRRVLDIVSENAGADHGLLLLEEGGAWVIKAETRTEHSSFPATIINYVARTNAPVVLEDAAREGLFTQDPYVLEQQSKSVLCTPLLHQGTLVGILYLENHLTTGAFTPDRVDVLNVLSAQAAISIEHAGLYNSLEQRVVERTQTLAENIEQLEQEIIEREAAEKALHTYREQLEDLVEERTADLTKAVTNATRLNTQLQQEVTERQRAEQTVRASEQQYRALAEHVADGIAIIRDGTVVFVNDALCSLMKYPADRLMQIPPVELFRDQDRDTFRQWVDQLMRGQTVPNLEAMCRTGDDQEIWTEERSRVIDWEGTSALLVTVRDITERKLHELEMEQRREHLYKENIVLRSTLKDRYQFGDIVGKSAVMQKVYEVVAHASASEANVVIYGEQEKTL